MEKLTDATQLDWETAKLAAQDIIRIRICNNAGFTAPEMLDVLQEKIMQVCGNLDTIVAALKITPPGARR